MLKERLSAAHAVRAAFLDAERSQDDAAINAARCLLTALEQRRDAKLPVTIAAAALDRFARAAHFAVQARNELMLAHPELATLPKEIGIERMFGDDGTCPPWVAPAEPELRIVA